MSSSLHCSFCLQVNFILDQVYSGLQVNKGSLLAYGYMKNL